MRESKTQRTIWPAVCAIGRTVLFRLNTGMAWVTGAGPVVRHGPDVIVPSARPVALGFGRSDGKPVVGAGDLIGWHVVVITPEMVGRKVAVFTSIECKSDDGVGTADQLHWMQVIREDGGIAVIAKTPAIAQAEVKNFFPRAIDPAQNRPPTD